MVDVFISYKSERRKAAAHLAKILECYGYTVWYDYSLVKGHDFAAQIDAKIREAKAVIVLWCSKSVRSEWVADEAALAADLDSLVPARIEDCKLRVDFHRKDYIDLTGWGGAPRDHALDVLLAALQQKTGRKPQQNFEAICEYEELWRRFGAPSLKAFALDAPVHVEQESSAGSDPSTLQQPCPPAKRDWEQAKTRHSAGTSSLTPRARVQAELFEDAASAAKEEKPPAAAVLSEETKRDKRIDLTALWIGLGLLALLALAFWPYEQESSPIVIQKREISANDGPRRVTARTRLLAIGKRSLWQFEASPGVWEDCGDDCEKALRRALVTRPDNTSAILQTPLQLQACDGVFVSVAQPEARLCVKPGSGQSFKDCPECPDMVVAPSGSLTMGSPKDEPERSNNEGRQHEVTIANFAVGRFAVTFAEWDACVAAGGCGGYKPGDEGWGRGNRPVINVSWKDAKAYVAWLSNKTGATYRLLSEAEREYAARAETKTPFWWGPAITPDQANYNGNYVYAGGGSKGEYRARTVPVKSFEPNPWGLYQVHGNVWEWVEDCWNDSYSGAPADGSARTTGECRSRVLRGGSWFSNPRDLRAAVRGGSITVGRYGFIGFRVARTLNP